MPAFVFVGDNLAVDLLNTVIAVDGRVLDLLVGADDVIDWSDAAGVVACRDWSVTASRGEPAAIRAIRETFRRGLERWSRTGGVSRGLIVELNRLLGLDPQRLLVTRGTGRSVDVRAVSLGSPNARLQGAVARSALELISRGDHRRLRHCANPVCVLQFYDTSKAGRRRWCSMETCGARSKMRSYYTRKRSSRRRGPDR